MEQYVVSLSLSLSFSLYVFLSSFPAAAAMYIFQNQPRCRISRGSSHCDAEAISQSKNGSETKSPRGVSILNLISIKWIDNTVLFLSRARRLFNPAGGLHVAAQFDLRADSILRRGKMCSLCPRKIHKRPPDSGRLMRYCGATIRLSGRAVFAYRFAPPLSSVSLSLPPCLSLIIASLSREKRGRERV